ncbi:hypothetical protein MSG28_004785 [Choristoneura fumiferana]|uniref:Uncharacterized protein n=1 Tax=Choristoneura fumiferana TaxID=7141 RepID=A0ACC0K7F4_CHOFU|nr:hypothetical protein MSG28_004785 [Choristoneura fumiferana]
MQSRAAWLASGSFVGAGSVRPMYNVGAGAADCLGLTLVASRHGPFYRTDYTYIYKYDAFYKVHWDGNGLSWDQASSTCADEESSLFYPEVKDEWTVVKALVAGMKKKPNVTDIIVGMSDEFGYGEIKSVGGDLPDPTPIPIEQAPKTRTCVIMDIETGSYNMTGSCEMGSVKSFVCKKKATCPTIDTEMCEDVLLTWALKAAFPPEMCEDVLLTGA